MKIGITYDLKSDRPVQPGEPVDMNAELDSEETVNHVAHAFEQNGHTVKKIGNVKNLLRQIDQLDVDIVFNMAEGHFGRNRESQVPVILEMYGIPFIGADALTLGITLDKVVAKKCFIADRIATPRYFQAYDSRNLEKLNHLGFPLIVKTTFEGTSKGLTDQSRVDDYAGLKRQVDLIVKMYHQPALVEEFIRGTEFTVPVLGNYSPQPMPIAQVAIDGKEELGDKFFTFSRVVSDHSVQYIWPAHISPELTREIQDMAVKAYLSVGCRDFGRVDFRVDEKGNPYVLEINPLPSLAKKDVFNLFPKAMGVTFEEVMQRILNFALERQGIKTGKNIQTQTVGNRRVSSVAVSF